MSSPLHVLLTPSQNDATAGLIELMKLFPPNVYFYINAWTWGYEDILKAVSAAFQTKVTS